jgi:FkbM family methyltransferase
VLNWLVHEYYVANPRFRRAVTQLLEGGGTQRVALLGADLELDPVQEHGYLRASRLAKRSSLFRDEIGVLMTIAAVLPTADAFVDIGANIGLFSATLVKLRQLYPLRFYAFEPNPDTYRRLVHNVAALGVETFQMGLSDRAADKEFLSGAVSHVFTTIEHRSRYSLDESTIVACRRLDSLPLQGDRLFLKIDVEGQELEVLTGAAALFEAGRVRGVYIDGFKDDAVIDRLKGYGFTLFDGRTMEPCNGKVFSLLALK